MPRFKVFEVYEETTLLRRMYEVEADSPDEAMELAWGGTLTAHDCGCHGEADYGESEWLALPAETAEQDAWEQVSAPFRGDGEQRCIDITVEGGCVTDVDGLPGGYCYSIDDRDTQEDDEDEE